MGADIYDWDRVHGKGSYAAMADAQDKPEQPRTDSKADDPIGELRWELGARTRQHDQVCRDMRALTEEVISALSTARHRMTLRGALPFCACGLSLGGGDASGVFITHILAVWRESGRPKETDAMWRARRMRGE